MIALINNDLTQTGRPTVLEWAQADDTGIKPDHEVIQLFSCSTQLNMKELHALRGYFGPLWGQKMKVAFT